MQPPRSQEEEWRFDRQASPPRPTHEERHLLILRSQFQRVRHRPEGTKEEKASRYISPPGGVRTPAQRQEYVQRMSIDIGPSLVKYFGASLDR